jgi:hypothetical protein
MLKMAQLRRSRILRGQEAMYAQSRTSTAYLPTADVVATLPQLATVHGGELHVWPTGDGIFHE